jgi:hypothetical protein
VVKLGTVISLNKAEQTGIIVDKNNREYFFSVHECCENELPPMWSEVTFVKDADFKSTNVAMLIKRSFVMKKIAG